MKIPDLFGKLLAEVILHTPLAADKSLRWTIIVNPTAGGFTIKSRWKAHEELLLKCTEQARANPPHPDAAPSQTAAREGDALGLITTTGGGHAQSITKALVEEARKTAAESPSFKPFFLVITAGGDGTSLEVLSALFGAPEEIRQSFAVLRLPMGTGNDGADAWELDAALERLTGSADIVFKRALRLTTATPGKGPFLAFNILSVGLDAFVTHMTNKMKGKLPGDSYKLWVDVASLLYDRLYKVGPLEVKAFNEAGVETASFTEKLLLLAVGESGYRTYGSHKHILPDERNVCAVKQMSVFRKVALKGLFTTGEHINKPESILFSARRVEFKGKYPILAQMDGEAVLLGPGDFPAAIELTPPSIPILIRKHPVA
jgi:diacylglycerol kinase family enzyme